MARITILLTTACVLLSLGGPAAGEEFPPGPIYQCKLTWEAGVLRVAGGVYNMKYRDAHLEIYTRGIVQQGHAGNSTEDGSFGAATPVYGDTLYNGYVHDTITVDWQVPDGADPIDGSHTVGLSFAVEDITVPPNSARPIVKKSTLTGVSVSSPTLSFTDETITVPGPVTSEWKKVNPVSWTFSLDDPNIQTPMNFQNVNFYRTELEPALSDLSSLNFPSLAKTLLHTEPDFILDPVGGMTTHTVTGLTADLGDWVIVTYTSTYDELILSGMAGSPVSIDVKTWQAGLVIPEPATMGLLAMGSLALLRRRKK